MSLFDVTTILEANKDQEREESRIRRNELAQKQKQEKIEEQAINAFCSAMKVFPSVAKKVGTKVYKWDYHGKLAKRKTVSGWDLGGLFCVDLRGNIYRKGVIDYKSAKTPTRPAMQIIIRACIYESSQIPSEERVYFQLQPYRLLMCTTGDLIKLGRYEEAAKQYFEFFLKN